MKSDHILNAELIKVVAQLGHKQKIVISDAGLPIKEGKKCIDLSLVKGVPCLLDVLKAVSEELVVESFTVAAELESVHPEVLLNIQEILPKLPFNSVAHEEFKEIADSAEAVIRTGECSSFVNIILTGGVNF